jgi:hypothetical protein
MLTWREPCFLISVSVGYTVRSFPQYNQQTHMISNSLSQRNIYFIKHWHFVQLIRHRFNRYQLSGTKFNIKNDDDVLMGSNGAQTRS